METRQKIEKVLKQYPALKLAILFGSVAKQRATAGSDLDIAVAGPEPLTATGKQKLIEELASAFGRPIDLIDLQKISGTLLHQILTKGKLLFCRDHLLYAQIINKMLFNQADMMPYHNRILKERRERWIGK